MTARPAPRFDAATSRAIRAALQSGATDDPRIDALARDAARRNLRRPWLMWGYLILSPLVLASAFVDHTHGAEHWLLVTAHLMLAAFFGSSGWQLAATRRRAHRYLRTRPTSAAADVGP